MDVRETNFMQNIKKQSNSGMASMFVVIFTTLLLGIVTLSFVRIMLSEATQTTNYDLSQSAYDSALAGIEDAKVALLKYQQCLSTGDITSASCKPAVDAIRASNSSEDCDIVSKMLKRPNTGAETIIQSQAGSNAGDVSDSGEALEQAYTCVKISEDTDDYLSTLNQNYRVKMVPIRTADNDAVKYVRLQWYNETDDSKVDSSSGSFGGLGGGGLTTNRLSYGDSSLFSSTNNFSGSNQAPPVIKAQFFQTAEKFYLADLDLNSDSKANRGTLLLRPSTNGTNSIANSYNRGLAASSDKALNNPVDVKCETTNPFYCYIDIYLPEPIPSRVTGSGWFPSTTTYSDRGDGSMFLLLSLPYGTPETSFSVSLYKENGELIQFAGVQTRIDSTGRANDLFRRVEARVEMVDVYYPYPEYTANLTGDDRNLWKNFYVTNNCWTVKSNASAACANYGTVTGD